jgi:hypothetical protein
VDNREAKFILNAYRPNGQDAGDPHFAEALKQAQRDPVLARWFSDSIAFDAAIAEKLCSTAVPGDLRENILAGVKVSRAPRWKKRQRRWAIAAAVILAAIVAPLAWHSMRPAHLAGWQSAALDVISSLVSNQSRFDAESRNPNDLIGWLRANHAPAGEKLPDNLDKLASMGCKTFLWHGKPVSLICFARPDGGLIHVVIVNASAASRRAIGPKPKLIQQAHWATATWREGDLIYMLALEGSRDQLRFHLL